VIGSARCKALLRAGPITLTLAALRLNHRVKCPVAYLSREAGEV